MAIYTKFKIQAPRIVKAFQNIGIKISTWNGSFTETSAIRLPSGVSACIFDEHAWGKTLYGSEEMGLPRNLPAPEDSKSLAVWLVKALCGFDQFDEDDDEDNSSAFCREFGAIIEKNFPGGDKWQKLEKLDDLIETAEFLYFNYGEEYDFYCEYIEVRNQRMLYHSMFGDDEICDGWYWHNLEEFVVLVKNAAQPATYERQCSKWVESTGCNINENAADANAEFDINTSEDHQPAWLIDYPIIKEIQGTGYEGRSARIEYVKVGDVVTLKADHNSPYYSPVAIEVFNTKNETLGYLKDGFGAESLVEIAKHLDVVKAKVASVTPLSRRTKRAKYALMDVEIYCDAAIRVVE